MPEQLTNQRKFVLLRILIVTALLFITIIAHVINASTIPENVIPFFAWFVAILYFFLLILLYFANQIKKFYKYSVVLIFIEITFSAGIILVSGGQAGIFSFFLFINILSSGIILTASTLPIFAAAFASFYFILLSFFELHILSIEEGLLEIKLYNEPSLDLLFSIILNVSGFIGVAGLMLWYLEELKKVRGALKLAETDLDEMENFHQNIVASIHSGLATVNRRGQVTFFNKTAERITGVELNEILQHPVEEIFPWFKDFDINIIENKDINDLRFEINYRRADDKDIILGYTLSPLKNLRDEVIGMIINLQDITRLKEMEKRIELEDRVSRLASENIQLKSELKTKYNFENIIGVSRSMANVFEMIRQIADTRTNVLISGESGTGKELVARAIHYNSSRKDKPFVTVNCSAIPETLIESELFGHRKGAFTGAINNKAGLFKAADQGTIFLDEIGEIPLSVQVKLLRVLQERSFKEVGGTQDIMVNVRIIAATNKNLEEEVEAGRFRKDLFYRLNVIHMVLPPLRERQDDIPLLAQHFLEKYKKELSKNHIKKISVEAMQVLLRYNYPGNVRELENIIERAVALENSEIIMQENLSDNIRNNLGPQNAESFISKNGGFEVPPVGLDLEDLIGNIEKDILVKALERTGGVKKDAAKLLNISFRSFRYRLAKYGIN